jgi:polyferredoxin
MTFLCDVVSTIPVDYIGQNNKSSYFLIFKFVKMVRLLRIAKFLRLLKSDTAKLYTEILKNFFYLMTILHWIALLFLLITGSSYSGGDPNRAFP